MISYKFIANTSTRSANDFFSLLGRHRLHDYSNSQKGRNDPLQNHHRAQILNNQAAFHIDSGQYDQAITLLVEALRLDSCDSFPTSRSSLLDMGACTCQHCTLEECIAYSERRAQRVAAQVRSGMIHEHQSTDGTSIAKKRKIVQSLRREERNRDTKDETNYHYIHRIPILITPTTIEEGHIMGGTLSLIATFNLALANHLKVIAYIGEDGRSYNSAIDSSRRKTPSAKFKRDIFRQVLRLYELAYEWQVELCRGQTCDEDYAGKPQPQEQRSRMSSLATPVTDTASASSPPALPCNNPNYRSGAANSVRFDMIMCNNLSEIHRLTRNRSKQKKCLEHLMAILMLVIDWQRDAPSENEDEDNYGEEGQQSRQRQTFRSDIGTDAPPTSNNNNYNHTVFSSSELWHTSPHSEEIPRNYRKRKRRSRYMDLDGFLHNITPLVLIKECAHAA